MTLVAINSGYIAWPGHCESTQGAPSVATDQTLAAGQYQLWVGTAREAMTISHIGFKAGAVTASGTATVAVRSVDTSGIDSADWAANTNLSNQTVTASSWNLYALTASASIAAGQVFGLKVAHGGSGTSFVLQRISNFHGSVLNLPYEAPNGTKARTVGTKLIVAGSSSSNFYQLPGTLAANSISNATFTNATSTTEEGLRFKVPFKCQCIGIRWWANTGAGADYAVILRNDAGTELSSSSTTFDGDYSANNAGGVLYSYFDNPVTLEKDTWYRATIQAASATSVTLSEVTTPGAAYLTAWPGGSNQQLTRFTSSAWDDTPTTLVPLMDILIDQVDDGTGSGGGAPGHANLSGGLLT